MLSLIEKILFILAVAAAAFLALRELRHKIGLIRRGRPVDRTDHPGERLGDTVMRVMFQTQVFANRPVTGFFHAMIFWGFFVFALVTLNHTAEGLIPDFSLFGKGLIYKLLIAGANLFAGLIMIAVVYFLLRRYVFKAKGLDRPSWQSLIILGFIFTLMASFVLYEAFKMYHEPISRANFLAAFSFRHLLPGPEAVSAAAVLFWKKSLWWLHILIVMAFGVFIMYSKHLHLLAGPVNIFLRNRGMKAEIPQVDLETQERFGTPNITDLTQKDLLDLFSCAECGRCEDVCPAFQSGKKLSPKKLLHDLKEHLLASESAMKQDPAALKNLFGEVIGEEELWDCTTCAACMENCPMFNEHVGKIIGIRQTGVLMESRFPEEFQVLYRGLENQMNPWGINADTRAEWAQELQIPHIAEKGETDMLLWIGCAGSFDVHSQKIATAFVKVLRKAGADFAFLGNDEKCCGDPARRTGMEYLYQMAAQVNIEILKQFTFKRIVTFCPHCYHVLRNEYPAMDGRFTVQHHSEVLAELLAQGKIRVKAGTTATVFHDPCYLGRYNDLYRPARQVLQAGGSATREMARHHATSFCCGAGGGGMWKEEKSGERIARLRVKQAAETGAAAVVTACPYCSIMFKDAIDETGLEGKLTTVDLAQVVLDRVL